MTGFPIRLTRFSNPNPFDVVYNNTNANIPSYQALRRHQPGQSGPLYHRFGQQQPDEEHRQGIWRRGELLRAVSPHRRRRRVQVRRQPARAYREAQQFAADLNPVSQNLTDYVSGPDIIYYNGRYNLGPQPIFSKLREIPQSP